MKSILSIIIIIFISSPIFASSISINPVLLTLNYEEPTSVFEVKNISSHPVILQADVKRWLQKDEKELYAATNDIVISPPLFQLKSKESQLLRIAWLTKHPLDSQLTYRVIVREIVPEEIWSKTNPEGHLRVSLAFSLPLFIQPQFSSAQFEWTGKWINPNVLKLDFDNKGNVTLFLSQIHLVNSKNIIFKQNTFAYVLPNQHKTFFMKTKKRNLNNINAMINGEWKIKSVQIKA